MEDYVLEIIELVGYTGPLLDKNHLKKAIEGGPKSVEYTQLVEWLSTELKSLCKLEDHVNAISTAEDSSSFLLELSSFLKETCCPHKSLMKGSVSQRLQTVENRTLLLVYLCNEVQAARIIAVEQPEADTSIKVQVQESSTANDLKTTLIALEFSKPPTDLSAKHLFSKLEERVQERLSQLPAKLVSKPLFVGVLSDKQWKILSQLHEEMSQEYKLRREMLLKRLDVTIQSFQWSGKAKSKMDEISSTFGDVRQQIATEPNVTLADLLASREDLTTLEKTSNANVRKNTQCAVNKVLIGRVPDRGGRPSEQRAPPPEMPSWQKRTDAPRGGGGRGGGGSRVQGGWSGGGGGGRGGRGGYRGGANYR